MNALEMIDRFMEKIATKRLSDAIFIIALMMLLGAVYTAFWSLHPILWIEGSMLAAGFALIILRIFIDLHLKRKRGPEEKEPAPVKKATRETLSRKLIRKLTLDGRLQPYFPILAIAIFVLIYLYNKFVTDLKELGNSDYIMICLAVTLMVYNRVPEKYSVEKDFVLTFFIAIIIALVIPLVILTLIYGNTNDISQGASLIHIFVSVPASLMANLFGVPSYSTFSDAGGTQIWYTIPSGQWTSVIVAFGCSGLFSVIIFSCAFASYALSSYSKFERRLIPVMLAGIALAWFANVIRIALTVGAGHWWGQAALLWFHDNIGLVIFLIWTAIFWLLLFKYLPFERHNGVSKPKASDEPPSG